MELIYGTLHRQSSKIAMQIPQVHNLNFKTCFFKRLQYEEKGHHVYSATENLSRSMDSNYSNFQIKITSHHCFWFTAIFECRITMLKIQ